MMTLLYIPLWLLSGFLAAWIGHICNNVAEDVSIRQALCWSLGGPLSMIVAVCYVVFESDVLKKPLFKAKEPK